jgi:hypothetical protein
MVKNSRTTRAGLALVLLSHFSALTPSIAAPVPTPPAQAPEWRLYEPVAEVVLPTGDANVPRAVEEKDGYVYLLAREGILYTYDISDLPLQQSFATYNTPVYKQIAYNGNGLLRHGNYLYVFGGNGLQTIDVQNPSMPSLLGLRNDLTIYNMVRHESYLIAAGWERIAVYSIEEPSNPALLSDLNMGQKQWVWSAAVYGSTLYACHWTTDVQGNYTNALSIIDFSNPAGLSVLNAISRDDQAYHLRVVGNQLVECTGSQVGLWDLTTPANPVFLTSQPAGGRVAAQDGDTIVTNGTALRPSGNELQIVATFAPGGSQRDGYPYGSAASASFVFIAQSPRILILHAGPPALSINHASGGPGSFFTITGHDFPPNSAATIVVNSNTLGTVPTDSAGECFFLLNTEQADEGRYVVTATANRSASTSFVIASGEPVHPQEGSGTAFQIPPGIAYGKYGGGNGMAEDPYQIWTPEQMNAIGTEPNDWGKHFKLMADIDLSGCDGKDGRPAFNIIAPDADPGKDYYQGTGFTGVFDGGKHKLWHLTIKGVSYLGLFGELASGAAVRDLWIEDVNVIGLGDCISALAALSRGSITHCYSTGVVNATGKAQDRAYLVGGLVASNFGDVTFCHSIAAVIGGVYVGGLVGDNWGSVTRCYSAGSVRGGGSVGGLVGENMGAVNRCDNWGPAAGEAYVGGLVGENYSGHVANCYSTGAVSGGWYAGGLIGQNGGTSDEARAASVTRCYSAGVVKGQGYVGGMLGQNLGAVTACFWDTHASGQAASAGGTGKSTAEMQTAGTFLAAGWDFVVETANGTEDIWWILEGQDYPRLWWETAEQ